MPDAKIAVFYQNNDAREDFLSGFKGGLGEAGRKLVVKEVTYETFDAASD